MMDWAVAGLGSTRFLPVLRLWTAVHGGFAEGWLPDSYLARSVLPGLQGAAGRRLGASRMLMRQLLGADLVPDRACRLRDFWLDRTGRPIPEERVEKTLFGRQTTLFLHREAAPRGQALIRVARACFARETSRPGDLTVLAPAAQDKELDALAPGALALLRVLTVKTAGAGARALGGLLRLPLGADPLPRPGAEIALALNLATGRIAGPGLAPDWTRIATHPETGLVFEGRALPGHDAALSACRALHDRVPQLALVAWDVLLGAGGKVQILDWEPAAPETAALQALCGPILAGLGWERSCRGLAAEAAAETAPALVPPPVVAAPGAEGPQKADAGHDGPARCEPARTPAETDAPPVRPRRPALAQAPRPRPRLALQPIGAGHP